MHFLDRIEAIKSRAELINVSLHALCDEAGADYSLFHKWLKGVMSPTQRVLNRECEKLEAALDQREVEIYAALKPRIEAQQKQDPGDWPYAVQ